MSIVNLYILCESSSIDEDSSFLTYASILQMFGSCNVVVLQNNFKNNYYWAKALKIKCVNVSGFQNLKDLAKSKSNTVILPAGVIFARDEVLFKVNVESEEDNVFYYYNESYEFKKDHIISDMNSVDFTPFIDMRSWMNKMYTYGRIYSFSNRFGNPKLGNQALPNQDFILKLVDKYYSVYNKLLKGFV